MYEFLLAFFIFVTIFVDSLAMIMKGLDDESELAKVYVSSQALTYLTRFSLFFILPIIGLILDGGVSFNLWLFFQIFSFLLIFHSFFIYKRKDAILSNISKLVQLYEISIFSFFRFCFFDLFRKNRETKKKTLNFDFTLNTYIYGFSHIFLSFIFPLLLIIGSVFPEYRALFMGMTNAYTGVFSIYITFFIERKIPYLKNTERVGYISSLMTIKLLSIVFSAGCLFVFSNLVELLYE